MKPDALAHLADALTEDIVATPPHQLALEEIVDARRSRELVFRFDDILAEASAVAGERPMTTGSSAMWNLTDALCEDIAAHPDETAETEVLDDCGGGAHSLAGTFDDIIRRDPHLAAAGFMLPRPSGGRLSPAWYAKTALAKLLDRLVATLPGRAAVGSFATAVMAAILTVIVYEHEPQRLSTDPMPFTAPDALTPGGGNGARSAAPDGRREDRTAAVKTGDDENYSPQPPAVRTNVVPLPAAVPDRRPENEPPRRPGDTDRFAAAAPDMPAVGMGAPVLPTAPAKRGNGGAAAARSVSRAASSVTGSAAVPPPASPAVTPDMPAAAASEPALGAAGPNRPALPPPPPRRDGPANETMAGERAGTAMPFRSRPQADALCSGPVTASFPSRCAAPLTAAQERGLRPRDSFRECADCPEMVVVPAGSFTMGSPEKENDRSPDEGPQHVVTIGRPLAVGMLHVTVGEFAVFAEETAYAAHSDCSWRDPGFVQEGSHPVVCVSFDDAVAYADWLAKKTGKQYRLLSEAEWEYAARGRTSPGTYPRFWFGDDENELCRFGNGLDQTAVAGAAPCKDGHPRTSPAGQYEPNAFGLYDMFGDALQWTADCWHDSYDGAPADGSAWTSGCRGGGHVVRGGAWNLTPGRLRAASRTNARDARDFSGFRVARALGP